MSGRTAWYPGHMAKGLRNLEKLLSDLDLAIEVRDARAPMLTSSTLAERFGKKIDIWIALTKADLADPAITRQWIQHLKAQGHRAFALDLKTKRPEPVKKALRDAGPSYRGARLAVFGIPNVGKSQLLNGLVGKKAAPVGGIPGLTRGVNWYQGDRFLVVDSPGILDPKSGAFVEKVLSWLGCSKVEVIGGYESLGFELLQFVVHQNLWPVIETKWNVPFTDDLAELYQRLGRRLGCLSSGAVVDQELTGRRLIDAFSTGKFGPLSLETPDHVIGDHHENSGS